MSTPLASAPTTPSTERPMKTRLRRGRRALTVTGVLLALVSGAVAGSGTAFAAPPSGSCTVTCNNPPVGSNISHADWNAAVEAADFWANHMIDWNQVDYSHGHAYYHLDPWAGRGWPGASSGNQWFGYWDSNTHSTNFIYYGGRFNDYSQDLSWQEQHAQGVSSSRAYSTGNGRLSPYVEYDIDYYRSASSSRNARRIVRNTLTGNVYATFDHYQTFDYIGHM
ncbi:ribonuclease domain-containing protein [Streptomyces sp. NPDC004237]|uniref:ribonuclease domain-containing protein n=1 Tax=Streptomyces sp. NPDC004237 TaxID=3154455 RepID=UPI0033B40550